MRFIIRTGLTALVFAGCLSLVGCENDSKVPDPTPQPVRGYTEPLSKPQYQAPSTQPTRQGQTQPRFDPGGERMIDGTALPLPYTPKPKIKKYPSADQVKRPW
jgi:hypothetical protein